MSTGKKLSKNHKKTASLRQNTDVNCHKNTALKPVNRGLFVRSFHFTVENTANESLRDRDDFFCPSIFGGFQIFPGCNAKMLFEFATEVTFIMVTGQKTDLADRVKLGAEQLPRPDHFQIIDISDRRPGKPFAEQISEVNGADAAQRCQVFHADALFLVV